MFNLIQWVCLESITPSSRPPTNVNTRPKKMCPTVLFNVVTLYKKTSDHNSELYKCPKRISSLGVKLVLNSITMGGGGGGMDPSLACSNICCF